MPFEPVGGLSGGYFGTMLELDQNRRANEAAEQRKQASQLELQDYQRKLMNQARMESGLAEVFNQTAMQQSMGDDKKMSELLFQGATKIMPLDAIHGSAMLKAATDLRTKNLKEAQMNAKLAREQADQQASILASIDNQESYAPAMEQFKAAGGKPIEGLTGDFAHDAPLLTQRYKSLMPVKDQLTADMQSSKLELAKDREENRQQEAKARLDMMRDRLAKMEEHKRIIDEDKALRQAGQAERAVARGEDQLHKMASQEAKPILELSRKAATLKNMVLQGNPAADKQVHQELTAFLGSARATNKLYADNASFGNVAERLHNFVKRGFTGVITDQQREYVVGMLDELEDGVFKPALQKTKEQYTEISKDRGYNPRHVLPPELYQAYETKGTKASKSDAANVKLTGAQEAWMSKHLADNPGKTREQVINDLIKAGRL